MKFLTVTGLADSRASSRQSQANGFVADDEAEVEVQRRVIRNKYAASSHSSSPLATKKSSPNSASQPNKHSRNSEEYSKRDSPPKERERSDSPDGRLSTAKRVETVPLAHKSRSDDAARPHGGSRMTVTRNRSTPNAQQRQQITIKKTHEAKQDLLPGRKSRSTIMQGESSRSRSPQALARDRSAPNAQQRQQITVKKKGKALPDAMPGRKSRSTIVQRENSRSPSPKALTRDRSAPNAQHRQQITMKKKSKALPDALPGRKSRSTIMQRGNSRSPSPTAMTRDRSAPNAQQRQQITIKKQKKAIPDALPGRKSRSTIVQQRSESRSPSPMARNRSAPSSAQPRPTTNKQKLEVMETLPQRKTQSDQGNSKERTRSPSPTRARSTPLSGKHRRPSQTGNKRSHSPVSEKFKAWIGFSKSSESMPIIDRIPTAVGYQSSDSEEVNLEERSRRSRYDVVGAVDDDDMDATYEAAVKRSTRPNDNSKARKALQSMQKDEEEHDRSKDKYNRSTGIDRLWSDDSAEQKPQWRSWSQDEVENLVKSELDREFQGLLDEPGADPVYSKPISPRSNPASPVSSASPTSKKKKPNVGRGLLLRKARQQSKQVKEQERLAREEERARLRQEWNEQMAEERRKVNAKLAVENVALEEEEEDEAFAPQEPAHDDHDDQKSEAASAVQDLETVLKPDEDDYHDRPIEQVGSDTSSLTDPLERRADHAKASLPPKPSVLTRHRSSNTGRASLKSGLTGHGIERELTAISGSKVGSPGASKIKALHQAKSGLLSKGSATLPSHFGVEHELTMGTAMEIAPKNTKTVRQSTSGLRSKGGATLPSQFGVEHDLTMDETMAGYTAFSSKKGLNFSKSGMRSKAGATLPSQVGVEHELTLDDTIADQSAFTSLPVPSRDAIEATRSRSTKGRKTITREDVERVIRQAETEQSEIVVKYKDLPSPSSRSRKSSDSGSRVLAKAKERVESVKRAKSNDSTGREGAKKRGKLHGRAKEFAARIRSFGTRHTASPANDVARVTKVDDMSTTSSVHRRLTAEERAQMYNQSLISVDSEVGNSNEQLSPTERDQLQKSRRTQPQELDEYPIIQVESEEEPHLVQCLHFYHCGAAAACADTTIKRTNCSDVKIHSINIDEIETQRIADDQITSPRHHVEPVLADYNLHRKIEMHGKEDDDSDIAMGEAPHIGLPHTPSIVRDVSRLSLHLDEDSDAEESGAKRRQAPPKFDKDVVSITTIEIPSVSKSGTDDDGTVDRVNKEDADAKSKSIAGASSASKSAISKTKTRAKERIKSFISHVWHRKKRAKI